MPNCRYESISSSSAAIPEKEDEVITEQIGVTRENLDDQQQPRQQPLQQRSWMAALANMSATKMIYIISFIMVAVVVVVLCGMLISDLFNSVKRNEINDDTNSNLLRGNIRARDLDNYLKQSKKYCSYDDKLYKYTLCLFEQIEQISKNDNKTRIIGTYLKWSEINTNLQMIYVYKEL
ncbi:unnamed protein product, partial [Adineta steineri]